MMISSRSIREALGFVVILSAIVLLTFTLRGVLSQTQAIGLGVFVVVGLTTVLVADRITKKLRRTPRDEELREREMRALADEAAERGRPIRR